jgi:hypothetical protein
MPNWKVAAVSRLLHRTSQHTQQTDWQEGMVQRTRQKVITTSVADFKPQHTAKTKQAWRYQGGQILRAPSKMINGKVYTDPKDKDQPRRKQESNFFITINSNKSLKHGEQFDKGVKHMEQMLKHLSTEEAMAAYFKFGPVNKEYVEDRFADVIANTDWKAAVETGDIMNRLHAHIWLTVTHYSQIQMNCQMLQHEARKSFNEGLKDPKDPMRINQKPYVHIKLLPQSDWTSVMRQYIHKGMTCVG